VLVVRARESQLTTARALIIGGLFLAVAATAASFSMVLGAVSASLWLCIVTFASSVVGLFVGILGALLYTRRPRHND